MFILVIGDFHIPDRANKIPDQIKRDIENEKYDMVISTGDYTIPEILEWVKSLAPNCVCVHGNMDDYEIMQSLPTTISTKIANRKVCIYHGHGIWPRGDPEQLSSIAMKYNASVIISGHTHKPVFKKYNGIYILNPGSATGAYSGTGARYSPSYMTIDTTQWTVEMKILRGKIIEGRKYKVE